jgi:large subunit ribosomal protein L9
MKVILLSDLHHVGHRGDVISAKPGFARNYLIPEGLAVQATHGNLKWFETQRKKIDERSARERQTAAEVAVRLDGTEITVRKRAGESQTLYGSVTATEIAGALHEKGFDVDRRRIDLEGGIKTLGEHEVRVRLHSDVVAAVKVTVVAETS